MLCVLYILLHLVPHVVALWMLHCVVLFCAVLPCIVVRCAVLRWTRLRSVVLRRDVQCCDTRREFCSMYCMLFVA